LWVIHLEGKRQEPVIQLPRVEGEEQMVIYLVGHLDVVAGTVISKRPTVS
jgi:hypothetical protein